MPSTGNSKPPFDRFPDGRSSRTEPGSGIAQVPDGSRVVFATPALMRALHTVLVAEPNDAREKIVFGGGVETGRAFGAAVDRELAARSQPALTDQPLEICLAIVERHFAAQGWGVLACDASLAPEHGIVTARLAHSCVVAALGPGNDFVDALPGGFLQGFLEHVSGQPLGCLEVGCARTGAPHCTFVITSADRLEPLAPLLGRTSPDEIIAQLKG